MSTAVCASVLCLLILYKLRSTRFNLVIGPCVEPSTAVRPNMTVASSSRPRRPLVPRSASSIDLSRLLLPRASASIAVSLLWGHFWAFSFFLYYFRPFPALFLAFCPHFRFFVFFCTVSHSFLSILSAYMYLVNSYQVLANRTRMTHI